MKNLHIPIVVVLAALAAGPCWAKQSPPTGVLAASVGDSVMLVEPTSGRTVKFDTGPVGWLFPAPGGILFAPDVINARTSVISLISLALVDRLDGLTMPYFSANPDRYTAITDEIVILSYPDRAVIKSISAMMTCQGWAIFAEMDLMTARSG